jgi:hypothetical protein
MGWESARPTLSPLHATTPERLQPVVLWQYKTQPTQVIRPNQARILKVDFKEQFQAVNKN